MLCNVLFGMYMLSLRICMGAVLTIIIVTIKSRNQGFALIPLLMVGKSGSADDCEDK